MSDVEVKNLEEKKTGELSQFDISGSQEETAFPSVPSFQKTNMVRQGGHLTEQIIGKSNKAKKQITDLLSGGDKENPYMIEDIQLKLNVPEHRMLATIRKFLNEVSEKDFNSNKYLMGNFFPNGEIELVPYGGNNRLMPSPNLRIKKSDFYREYTGKDKYSGKDKINADKTLSDLCNKKLNIIYPQTIFIDGQEKFEIILEQKPLITQKEVLNILSPADAKSPDNWIPQTPIENDDSYIYINLNPLWIDQIKNKFVEYPEDLNIRLLKTLKTWKNLNNYILILIDIVLHWRSNKQNTFEYNEEKLYERLGLTKFIKQRKTSKAEKYLFDAIETLKTMKLINEAKRTKGVNNQYKWVFSIYLEIPEMT
jgi:hypothetical protein